MHTFKSNGSERGSALLISLLVLLSLTLIGGLFMAQTKTETQVAGHDVRWNQALYHAEAGYGEVLARMSDVRDTTNFIGEAGGWASNPGWGRYVVLSNNASADDPDYTETESDNLDNDGDGQVDESGEAYPEVATAQSGNTVSYPWAKVRYKLTPGDQVVLYGDHDRNAETPPVENVVRGFPVIRVTAHGTQGTANRTLEVEAYKVPFQIIDAATYAEDDDFQFNGTQFLISGQDWDPDTGLVVAGNPDVPGILTTGDPNAISGALNQQQQNNVEGQGPEPSVQLSPINLDLQALRDAYVSYAEYTIPQNTYSNVSWGSRTEYTVVHCTGDMHVSGGGAQGGGLLIVDGDFDCSGQFTWYGLVLVLGDITFTGGGSGIHIWGCVLTQGGIDQQTVGGNADILYSSIALQRLTAIAPYRVASWQEL